MMNVEFLKENGIDVDKSLELFGDMQTYNDTIGEFILGASQKLPKLEEYKNKKDMNNYAIYVHSLKSDAKYFGFDKLAELSYNHELESKANHIYYVYDHFDELMDDRVTRRELEEFKAEVKRSMLVRTLLTTALTCIVTALISYVVADLLN